MGSVTQIYQEKGLPPVLTKPQYILRIPTLHPVYRISMTEERTIKGLGSSENEFSAEEIQTVKELMRSFCMALRNSALYPEGHSSLQKTLTNFKSKLDNFFQTYGSLRLHVDKEELLYCGEAIHNDNVDGENIAFALFRDGIQWFEFQEGFEQEEVSFFFKIINQYRMLGEETEGDIVTALYDSNFTHLLYEAKNTFWEGEPLIEFSSSDLAAAVQRQEHDEQRPSEEGDNEEGDKCSETEEGGEGQEHIAAAQIKEVTLRSIADLTRDHTLWNITSEEREKLEAMVLQEENWNSTGDVLDVLMVILEAQNTEEDFTAVLEYTKEELQETLAQGEFFLANNLLKNLLMLGKTQGNQQKRRNSLIEEFFQDISEPEFLSPIMQGISAIDCGNHDLIKVVRQTLLLLSPKAILSLGPLLVEVKSNALQKSLMEVIGTLAYRDIEPLAKLLDIAEEKIAEKLIFILGYLKGEEPAKILNNMINHSSALLRREALNAIIKRDPKSINKFFALIDDPSPSIRNSFLSCLGRERSTLSENRLLLHMEKKQFLKEDDQHVLACFQALGGCGSSKSIPFLKNILFAHGWNKLVGLGKSVHRYGAAEALLALDNEQARALLEEASQSTKSEIQQAAQKAFQGESHG